MKFTSMPEPPPDFIENRAEAKLAWIMPRRSKSRLETNFCFIHFLINVMEDYAKQPLDHQQILQSLKQRGLSVANDEQAIEQLKIISYFRLANYLRPMEEDKEKHSFKPNSHFENALDLYYFDKALRALLFTTIQSFEIALRSKLIHHFSLRYGPFWITDRKLFVDHNIFNDCTIRIHQEVFRSKEDFIQEHFEKYSNPAIPPVWKTLEVVSLGTLSKIFCNLEDCKLKKMMAREFNLPQHEYLESWCKCTVALRNCLAHHSRTWNRTFPLKPKLPERLTKSWINISDIPRNKLYAQLCCLSYLQNATHPANCFKHQLKELLAEHPNVDVSAMGFPVDWQKQPLWA